MLAEICPSEDDLLAFVQGFLAGGEAAATESHLVGCASCARLVAETARSMVGQSTRGESRERAPVPSARLAPGAKLGRYSILELVGHGAMGAVYAAYDPQLDRRVAIKLLRADARTNRGGDAQERLLREAQAMARLSHPNVLAIHDVGTFEDGVFLAMELGTGGTLRSWLDEKPRDWHEIVRLFAQAGEGLAAAHRAGIVHRDFKPDNVLLQQNGRVLVTDFGVARVGAQEVTPIGPAAATLPQAVQALTQTGTMAGTPAYMAPEQFLGKRTDARADVFGFCASLYEALFGAHPFPTGSLPQLRDAVCRGEVREPPRAAKVPAYVRAAVLRGLKPEPDDRFQDMESLLRALHADQGRRRGLLVAALALAVVGAIALGAREWRRSTLPSGERTLWLEITGAAEPPQEWFGRALQRLAVRKLRELDRRYQVADDADASNVTARVRWRLDGEQVVLEGELGRTLDGRPRPLPAVRARSAAEALDGLFAALGERLDAGRPPRQPDAREARQMREAGAKTLAAWLLYQRAVSTFFSASISDDARAVELARAAIAAEPRWPHPYLIGYLALGGSGDEARAIIEQGLRTADLTADPAGAILLRAAAMNAPEAMAARAELLKGAAARWPQDVLTGYFFGRALKMLQRTSEAVANDRELFRHRPDLQFGADLALTLVQLERHEESRRLVRDWSREAPDNEEALLQRAVLAFQEKRFDDVEADLRRVLLVHGEALMRLQPIAFMLLNVGKVTEARRLGERLLRGNDAERAGGRLLLGYAAILGGRLTAAYGELQEAYALSRNLGVAGRAIQALDSLRALAPHVAGRAEVVRYTEAEAEFFKGMGNGMYETLLRFERVLLDRPRGAACPDVAAALGKFSGPSQTALRPLLLRSAADAGCLPCKDAIRAGLTQEQQVRSVYLFAVCAEAEGALPLARQAYERVAPLGFEQPGLYYSPYHSVLARFRLARLAERAGDVSAAKRGYEEFLAFWGRADSPIAEVEEARAALSRLERTASR